MTCDSPTGPARHLVALAIQPVLRVALGTFGGMSVDQARLIVVRPPADTVATKSFDFSADSAQITANVSVPVTDTATFWVTIQLLSGNTLMFSGLDTVLVTSVRGEPSEVLLTFVGPGTRIASIQIAPRDSGVSFGGSLQFRLTAADSSQQPVTQFYAAWSTPSSLSGAGNTINADGLFRAGRTRANNTLLYLASDGSFLVKNNAAGSLDLVVDVARAAGAADGARMMERVRRQVALVGALVGELAKQRQNEPAQALHNSSARNREST